MVMVLVVVMVLGGAGVDGESVSGGDGVGWCCVDGGYVGNGISDGVVGDGVAVVIVGICIVGGGYAVGSSGVRGCGDRVSDPPPPLFSYNRK